MHRLSLDLWSLLRSVLAHREHTPYLPAREVTQRHQGSVLDTARIVLRPGFADVV